MSFCGTLLTTPTVPSVKRDTIRLPISPLQARKFESDISGPHDLTCCTTVLSASCLVVICAICFSTASFVRVLCAVWESSYRVGVR